MPPTDGKSLKSWSFPKRHALEQIFDDIEAKGATKNTSTKPNKKMHGPLQEIYLRQTNFKDVVPQVMSHHFKFMKHNQSPLSKDSNL